MSINVIALIASQVWLASSIDSKPLKMTIGVCWLVVAFLGNLQHSI